MDGWELFVEKEMYNEASNLAKMQLLKFPKGSRTHPLQALGPIPSKHSNIPTENPSPPTCIGINQRSVNN